MQHDPSTLSVLLWALSGLALLVAGCAVIELSIQRKARERRALAARVASVVNRV